MVCVWMYSEFSVWCEVWLDCFFSGMRCVCGWVAGWGWFWGCFGGCLMGGCGELGFRFLCGLMWC